MKKNLFLMCGIPGAGKSTWLAKNRPNACVISRDKIRFSIVKEDEYYFSKEKEVFNTYIKNIQDAIDNGNVEDIYCDATQINQNSRNKVLNALDLTNVNNVTVLVVHPSLEETLKRNEERTGRAYVPKSVIRRMWNQFERPEYDEPRIFDTMYVEVPKEWEKFT